MIFSVKDYLPDFISEESTKMSLKNKLSEYFGRNITLVTNGTHAIEIALRAMGLKRGTQVLLPDISFIATATAIANCGLIPVYADVSPEYFGLTIDSVKESYNENIKAVIVVHFGGFVNRDIFEIKKFCEEKNIYLIEDCAQVFPCKINGKRVGTIGDAGTFSFQTSKIVNCGEGGMITTNSLDLTRRCEAVANWGLSLPGFERDLDIASSNYRMGALQSYFILKQLDIIDEIVSERNKRCNKFSELCKKYNIKSALPKKIDNITDCPFFFPIKSKVKYNTNEPRSEYPMRKSKMVKSILQWFYPDLFEKYLEVNHSADVERFSDIVVKENDFINILHSYNPNTSPETIIKQYVK